MTDMDFMKFVDELQGQIDKLKKMIKGAEKSDVAITPTLESGEKLADYSIDGDEGSIYAPPNIDYYSTTERVVGQWIDGKEVFEKTIDFGALPNNTTKSVAHEITNLGKIVSIMAISASDSYILDIPYVSTSTNTNNVELSVTSTDVVIRTGADRSVYADTHVILRYTKTTTQNTRKKTKKED